ncbi:MAG: DoxX family protein [Bacteroidetes bacterium]|nr:DoxX family protein [Bacteroidota bacterium]
MIKALILIARIIFGLVFIFSGFVKAIDPLGTAYKLQDYFMAFEMEWLMNTALPISIIMNAMEFIIGLAVLLGLKMKYSAWGGLLFMLFFTSLTLYIAIANPVPDCGCFGDAIVISNWSTFYKNIVFLAAAVFLFYKRKEIKPLLGEKRDWVLVSFIGLFIFGLSVYCLRNLPIIDFRPWKVGNNIPELMKEKKPAEIHINFLYKNSETGEEKELSQQQIMNEGTPQAPLWTFVGRKEKIIDPGMPAIIDNFQILDEFGDDYAEYYLEIEGYVFFVIAYDLNKTNKRAIVNKINNIALSLQENNIPIILLTGSTFQQIEDFKKEYDITYPIYQSDEISLKTIIRSNPGLLLMQGGVVIKKWAYRNIENFDKISRKYLAE